MIFFLFLWNFVVPQSSDEIYIIPYDRIAWTVLSDTLVKYYHLTVFFERIDTICRPLYDMKRWSVPHFNQYRSSLPTRHVRIGGDSDTLLRTAYAICRWRFRSMSTYPSLSLQSLITLYSLPLCYDYYNNYTTTAIIATVTWQPYHLSFTHAASHFPHKQRLLCWVISAGGDCNQQRLLHCATTPMHTHR